MTYVRAEKAQIDAWEQIGNPGWTWDGLFPYYKKQEDFDYPTRAQLSAGASYVATDRGENGSIEGGIFVRVAEWIFSRDGRKHLAGSWNSSHS